MTSVPSPPWHYRLAQRMIRAGLRGPGLWLRLAARIGWLPERARIEVDDRFSIEVPLRRREYWWDAAAIRSYEAALLDAVASRVSNLDRPVTLIDGGADIGLFAALLGWRGVTFERIVAVEPNAASWPALESNLGQLGCQVDIRRGALGQIAGRGRLVQPAYDASSQALHLEADSDGDVPVFTVDSLDVPRSGTLLLKLDLEGGELTALEGAAETLRTAEHFLICIEAHHRVAQRTGVDPMECVRLANSQRSARVQLAERPDLILDVTRGYFDQVADLPIGNLLVESR